MNTEQRNRVRQGRDKILTQLQLAANHFRNLDMAAGWRNARAAGWFAKTTAKNVWAAR